MSHRHHDCRRRHAVTEDTEGVGEMAVCELCGNEAGRLVRARVENTTMMLGPECMRFGKPVDTGTRRVQSAASPARSSGKPVVHRQASPVGQKPAKSEGPDPLGETPGELAGDYPKRILGARNALGLKQEELAARLNEKRSVIRDLESGKLSPSDALIRKLEGQLKIKLLENAKYDYKLPAAKKRELTLGDFLEQ